KLAMVDSPTARKTLVVPDIKPSDAYDRTRAKICASVGWLLAKSYGGAESVPAELRDPFYCDQYEQEHLKPPVTRLLQSSELYCRTYGLLLGGGGGGEAQPKDNGALLQLLAERGVVPKDQGKAATDADLRHKPIKMSSHLAMMDALMAMGAMETVAVLPGGASKWEDALLHWVNELNQKLRERTEGAQNDASQAITEPEPVQPSLRYRKDKTQSKQKPIFPTVDEVKDLSTGCAVAAVIHYYCPGLLRLEDVCMKESMSVADSLYNLHFIHEFCDSCLKSCCHLSLEDMLYTPQELQVNLLSFLAELLSWFEVRRPEFVQPIDKLDYRNESYKDGSTPVSQSSLSGSSPTEPPLLSSRSLSSPSPLLRQSGSLTQSTSMSHIEGVGKTWSKKPLSRPMSAVSFSIPFGLDSDVDIVMGNPVITRSLSSDQLNPAGQNPQSVPRMAEENGLVPSETGELPTIEEALQIIHSNNKMEPRLHPDGAPDGFYLHSPDDPASSRHNNPTPTSCSAPTRSGSRDDDSVLRDGSVDSDASEDFPKTQSTPTTPAAGSNSARAHGREAPDSGVKMTSFAERKKKQMTTWAQKSDESPSNSPQLNNEVSELGTRLEEKRKAIEAQKKRIEAIFAKHRQRLGKSAFLQLRKEQSDGGGGEGDGQLNKQAGPSRERAGTPGEKGSGTRGEKAAPLGDYNNAVSKLTAALSSLQSDMQRLTEQQNHLIKKKPAVSGPQTFTQAPSRHSRESTRDFNSTSSSPSHRLINHSTPPKSPKVHRRAQSVPPKPSRSLDVKVPALSRVITAPQNVDRIPHRRRVEHLQSQNQALSSLSFGDSDDTDETSKRSSLIEISLRGNGEEDSQVPDAFSDSMSELTEPEGKGGVGFFFKDEKERPEDEMAQRRAALLEKQQKRAEEMKRRKLEQEKEKELNKPQWMIIEGWANKSEDGAKTPGTPPTARTPPVEGTPQRRGDFTRLEYERRHQLKIMEDLDKVLRQKPTTVRGVKKQRPKAVFRDDSVLSHSPIRGFMGTKVYSRSTMNLSSMANDSGGLTVRKSPSRSHSPGRLMSPKRASAHNGEKDWENGSTISSPASIPEYTGPKLYKEPSFKSNKFIIHNAITRCCLAGKVNEPQKNKIVEEMDASMGNHFLILFRDASCQFRAVYTMNPETEEMVRLTGIGPRIIAPEMVESIYKYSSDRKQFTAIPSKTMSMNVDAFTIPGHFWQKRPGTPKKLGTPK
uniref:Calmodulin regulated spectrin-associated protein family, member 3 n=1 Tax=Gasterosteus aculeatus TaxID=69293 RepID=G3P6E6_GASAC